MPLFTWQRPLSVAGVARVCRGTPPALHPRQHCEQRRRSRSGQSAPTRAGVELPEKEKEEEEVVPPPATSSTRQIGPQLGHKDRRAVDKEILDIALPTLATLAADPIAGLISTAWVGRLGSVELAGVGVALSLYNTTIKLVNVPLLSVTTSTVAAALGRGEGDPAERVGAEVSSLLALALLTGAIEAALLGLFGVLGLDLWGAGPSSSLHSPAVDYLTVRALSAPATVLFLTLQGAFRGLGDTRAPFYTTLACSIANAALEPVLIFGLGWGVKGAAGAIVASQAAACGTLIYLLGKKCTLRLPDGQALQSAMQYLGPTGLLTIRTLSINGTFAMGTALAARTDAVHAAAHQVCFQIWLASGLLADSLAVAAQSLIARYMAARDRQAGQVVVDQTVKLSLLLGLALMAGLGSTAAVSPRLFTEDPAVLSVVALLMPAVVATQPLNSLAFLADGVLYGVGGFQYAAQAMVIAVLPALAIMWAGSAMAGAAPDEADLQLYAVWAGFATLMIMRIAAIFVPYKFRVRPFEKLFG